MQCRTIKLQSVFDLKMTRRLEVSEVVLLRHRKSLGDNEAECKDVTTIMCNSGLKEW
jgi:hypothetical protein